MPPSSSVIVPVAVSLASTVSVVAPTVRSTVNLSSGSTISSSVVSTVNVRFSFAVPVNVSTPVFFV